MGTEWKRSNARSGRVLIGRGLTHRGESGKVDGFFVDTVSGFQGMSLIKKGRFAADAVNGSSLLFSSIAQW